MRVHAAHLGHLSELGREVIEVELALLHARGERFRFILVDGLGDFLDQGDHIAHAEDARGNALGVERFEFVDLLAHADEFDRLAGDRPHGKGSATARVTVHPGKDDAAEIPIRSWKDVGEMDGILAGQAVGNQERLMRIDLVTDRFEFDHKMVVDMQATGGVENDHVNAFAFCGLLGAHGDVHGLLAEHDRQALVRRSDRRAPGAAAARLDAARQGRQEEPSSVPWSSSR